LEDVSPDAGGSITHNITTTVQPQWPANTNIVFSDGRTKILITSQQAIVHVVLQEAIENVHANLVFHHAFPDAGAALAGTRAALINAAMARFPSTADLHNRLLSDEEYMANMIVIVSIPYCILYSFDDITAPLTVLK